MGNPPPMRVDTPSLTWDPAVVTVPPVPTIPPGGDPMSLLISGELPELGVPLTTAVAETRTREDQFAANLARARSAYQSADQAGEQEIRSVDNPQATGAVAGAAAGGAAGGQSGQMMNMAMQAASQAAQAPTQMMGMAAAAPQGIMQGAQGAFQQMSQLSGQLGKPGGEGDLPMHDSPGAELGAPSAGDGAGNLEQPPVGEQPAQDRVDEAEQALVGEQPDDDPVDEAEQAPAAEPPPPHAPSGRGSDDGAAAINL